MWNRDALVTGAQAAAKMEVSRATICHWRKWRLIEPKEWRGRSPLYRWGDILDAECKARQSPRSPRHIRRRAAA